ncbi:MULTISPECIES: hypothetical protein [Methylomonas]|uniref:Uncharacterized protein n=2 Tax=Methylomonas TaxID=416 RepID=A0A126T4R1_9GAMM|nr:MULTISPECIES: hypothetical protein [Methylomonas]AMK77057.1 hypothetical protein JT25_011250 [Methylomonas denitrificans]OAH96235.1 hypothetical protein A1342_21910 [Methylomonas methanica]TCV76887.1 hypothetical protein EDE11_1318 [Methylomonas methanica]
MKINLLLFSILIGVFFSSTVMAKPHSLVLPTQFPLKKIQITVSSQSNKENAERYQISINGNGNSYFIKNNQQQPLNVTNDTLIELLNDFYAVHFFEISDTFNVKKKVVLKDSQTVTTIVNKEPAIESKKVCVQLRYYKKCLSVIDNQPLGVSQIVNKIETLTRTTGN